MSLEMVLNEYRVERDNNKCIRCGVCVRQCANEVHFKDEEDDIILANNDNCVDCQRCVTMCPTRAITIIKEPNAVRENANWTADAIREIQLQARTGGVLSTGMGSPKPYPIYWDKMMINASQVTNPSIDPLREPMETRVLIGRKPEKLSLSTPLPPQLTLNVPVMFSAMSFGSISRNAQESLARAATEIGTFFNTGEGGLHQSLRKYGKNAIVQVASGRFGVEMDYLNAGAAIEIKIGQGAKPGIGGHLPGEKVNEEVSATRMIPIGTDAISPAPHHDIYSIEDLRQLIYSLKEATDYKKPVFVKIAAVHNVAAIASGIAHAGADAICIDGFRGGTGSAPMRFRDNVGIPIELALAAVDKRLRDEGLRHQVSLIVGGSIRNSADVIKAIALGADAVYIASSALIAIGCHMCRNCYSGKCNWGICTQRDDLVKRLNPDIMAERAANLLRAWQHEIQELLGGMGINAIESLKGNRLMLRGVGLNRTELEVLGISHAGEN